MRQCAKLHDLGEGLLVLLLLLQGENKVKSYFIGFAQNIFFGKSLLFGRVPENNFLLSGTPNHFFYIYWTQVSVQPPDREQQQN